jgi:hypothetical protein
MDGASRQDFNIIVIYSSTLLSRHLIYKYSNTDSHIGGHGVPFGLSLWVHSFSPDMMVFVRIGRGVANKVFPHPKNKKLKR